MKIEYLDEMVVTGYVVKHRLEFASNDGVIKMQNVSTTSERFAKGNGF